MFTFSVQDSQALCEQYENGNVIRLRMTSSWTVDEISLSNAELKNDAFTLVGR